MQRNPVAIRREEALVATIASWLRFVGASIDPMTIIVAFQALVPQARAETKVVMSDPFTIHQANRAELTVKVKEHSH